MNSLYPSTTIRRQGLPIEVMPVLLARPMFGFPPVGGPGTKPQKERGRCNPSRPEQPPPHLREINGTHIRSHFMRSNVCCRISQSLRPLTFAIAPALIAASFAFLVGLFTL